MTLITRSFLLLVTSIALAHAQPYPSKPSRIVVGFTAGGPSDIVARIVAQQLTERMGQSFIVENRVGATGTIGAELVAEAPPDGYALYLASQTTHAVAPYMYAKVGYDPLKDFATVVRVVHNPLLMVVNPAFPVTSIKELIALAKARPGELTFASSGNFSSPHLAGELLNLAQNIRLVHIPYKGTGPAAIAAMTGETTMMFGTGPSVVPHLPGGRLRALATTGVRRSIPELPTIGEFVPRYEVTQWYGILVPTGTPREIVERLHREIVRCVANAKVTQVLANLGTQPMTNAPDEFRAFIQAESDKWSKVIKAAKIKAD